MFAIALSSLLILPVLGQETNVYGNPMAACGPRHAGGCIYEANDAGAHEVCVTQLPKGFSSQTGQGPWSEQFAGQPWCICIWAYSNYILQSKDLALTCQSIPSKVLEEQYSLHNFEQCGNRSSKEGCGAEDIRRSIQSLCQQCDAQAGDKASKSALKAKCDKILAAAPAAPMSQLQNGFAAYPNNIVGFAQVVALSGFGLAAALTGVAVAKYSFRSNQGTARNLVGEQTMSKCVLDEESRVAAAEADVENAANTNA